MHQTRRTFLKLCGGATAGVIASPLPWKLLDDASIWTQNWSWIARPPRGPVSWFDTTCTLCPAGCGLRVRLVGGAPVSAWAVPGHPVSDGCVCPTGLGAAQVRFHPARIRGTVRRTHGRGPDAGWQLADTDQVVVELGRRLRRLRERGALDRVAILDLRPGRSLSTLYHGFLERLGGGRYLTLPDGRDLAAATLTDLVGETGAVPGYDFARAGAVLGCGAPLLDGWCGAGPAPGLLRADGRAPLLIQADSHASATASRADRWLPIRPGTEATLALGLAHLLLKEGRVGRGQLARIADLESGTGPGYRDVVRPFTPERVARVTGCDPRALHATARDLAACRSSFAVGGGDPGGGPLGREEEAALWGLNLLLGNVGGPGGVILRRDLAATLDESAHTPATSLWDLPDDSLELLIVDGAGPGVALPRDLLGRKLAGADALLVGLSPFVGGPTAAADIILPVPAFGEWTDEMPSRALAARTSYAVAPAAVAPPPWARHPADLLDGLAAAAGATPPARSGAQRHRDLLRRRAEVLHARGRGEVFDPAAGQAVPVWRMASADQLARLLARGGCWTEAPDGDLDGREINLLGPDRELASRFTALADGRLSMSTGLEKAYPLVLTPHGRQGEATGAVLPPVVNKLHRESHLRADPGRAHLNPVTAAAHGLHDGRRAILETPQGRQAVTVICDETVMPGVVRVATGPDPVSLGDPDDGGQDILTICEAAQRPVWRVGHAALREV
jgi:anaerobic selenocysteine-containing dehydrogenase